jgi:tripartite-type tricarboxylate transporter receptor subunit TctC
MQFSKFSFWKSAVVMSLMSLSTMTIAQTYPTKPVHFVVAFTAGSGTDIIARAVGDVMSGSLGQPIIIDNKPGAGGTIAASQVAKSEPDGYNLLVHSAGHALNPFIYPSLNYDTLKDLTGVIPLAALPNVLVVSPNKPWKTVADLIAATKEKPGELNYASAGVGSATHMNAEKFNLYAGIKATHVPYKGTPEAISDVIGGRADWYFAPLSSALPLIQGGKLKALAVSTPKRTSALPNVPTTIEAGVPNSDYVFWVGLIAPSGTSPLIIKKLNDEVLKTLGNQEVKDRFAKLGAEPLPMSPEAFNTFIKAEMEVASKISKAANLKN